MEFRNMQLNKLSFKVNKNIVYFYDENVIMKLIISYKCIYPTFAKSSKK